MRHPVDLRSERGAALIETALIASLVIVLAVGAAEMGFALLDWLAVSSATREGARTGSASGDDPAADTLVLAAVDQALASNPSALVKEVWIFRSDSTGSVSDPLSGTNIYRKVGGGFVCDNGCPWAPTSRSTNALSLDYLGVRVVFSHDWITDLVPWVGNETWQDDTVMRLEPAQS
ncbi:MAG: TadE/TadG family type IV pilus assembly protein [Acidimicrobiia bacterium]